MGAEYFSAFENGKCGKKMLENYWWRLFVESDRDIKRTQRLLKLLKLNLRKQQLQCACVTVHFWVCLILWEYVDAKVRRWDHLQVKAMVFRLWCHVHIILHSLNPDASAGLPASFFTADIYLQRNKVFVYFSLVLNLFHVDNSTLASIGLENKLKYSNQSPAVQQL